MNWKTVTVGILGIFLVVFCAAWTVSSALEGEPQAAVMGLLVFGLPLVVVVGVFRRLILRSKKNSL